MNKQVKCINNEDCEDELIINEVYEVIKESDTVYYINNEEDTEYGYYKHRFIEVEQSEQIIKNTMTLDQIVSQIQKIIDHNQIFKLEFYSNQVCFCIYESEVVISYTSKDNFLCIDCDLTNGKLDTRVVNELNEIMKLLDDNKGLLRKFCE